jgi:hypothetical protein
MSFIAKVESKPPLKRAIAFISSPVKAQGKETLLFTLKIYAIIAKSYGFIKEKKKERENPSGCLG